MTLGSISVQYVVKQCNILIKNSFYLPQTSAVSLKFECKSSFFRFIKTNFPFPSLFNVKTHGALTYKWNATIAVTASWFMHEAHQNRCLGNSAMLFDGEGNMESPTLILAVLTQITSLSVTGAKDDRSSHFADLKHPSGGKCSWSQQVWVRADNEAHRKNFPKDAFS